MNTKLSFVIYSLLLLCGGWLYIEGKLFQLFNGNTTLYHIAYELDDRPLIRYGFLLLYFIGIVMFIRNWKMKKVFHIVSIGLISLFVIPLYTHIIVHEIQKEQMPVREEIKDELNRPNHLDFAIVETFTFHDETKQLKVTLNYGTAKNNVLDQYLDTGEPLTENKVRTIKRRLNDDMMFVVNRVWSSTHKPKTIVFKVNWGEETIYTTTIHKKDRYLSYIDNSPEYVDERDKKIVYYHIDVVEKTDRYVLMMKDESGNWSEVMSKQK
ncbi:hypothetical protein [Salirhabdus salicampi]|uniref:hypothetical protein n=1 Tax=Salirhabdus salicampi TaxID=476102 RepID=UPI0020C244F3|nr:hypothetical protein [Salirhabdus salicampi]MCP8615417.1 hypothetical protein [Salirhabdus salicampi]